MASDFSQKRPRAVPPFQIGVLGGIFQVSEVLLADEESDQQVIATITTTPEERWFVMVSEDPAEQKDSLAIIDDDLAFQVVAYGILKPE